MKAATTSPSVLIVACGAISHEVVSVLRASGWNHVRVRCLPADLHNTPREIPEAVRAKIRAARGSYQRIFVAYADCGTGGLLDRVLEQEGVERLAGAHCYEMFAGSQAFATLCEQAPGTFYLTDFLVRNFERLIIRGLGLDRYPQLRDAYFGNYRRLMYLAQTSEEALLIAARAAAQRLGLDFEHRYTGCAGLRQAFVHLEPSEGTLKWQS